MTAAQLRTDFPCKRLDAGGISLNVIDVGEGQPVMLVHGFPDTHAVWRKQIPALVAAGYRVIAPDMRGCGESEIPVGTSSYKLPQLVADLVAVLDGLALEKVKLVGHDWGAVIAWQFTIAHPERVEKYIAMSVGHPNAYARGGVMQKLKGWYVLAFQFRGAAEFLIKAQNWLFFRKFTGYSDEWATWIAALKRPGRLTAGINYYRANWIDLVLNANFAKVSVPVAGIYSEGDRFLTEGQMKNSARHCEAGFEYHFVDGANHWMQLHAPERVNALLLVLLTE